MKIDLSKLKTVLVTDCGSTTTKALLFELTKDGWRQTFRGEAPTTVEEPVADVTVGALNAFSEIEELGKRKILKIERQNESEPPFVFTGSDPQSGIDLYLSTSSAGGGLQMMVMGIVKEMSAESAERAALGAGAIVMDVVSADDGREEFERTQRIRHIRPDIVLITGGVDSGSRTHVIEMAEMLLSAQPRPRFGETLKLPVIYAGNKEVAAEVSSILGKIAQVSLVDNVRPSLATENLAPAREAIHEFFLKHVMSHSPGYSKLLNWSPVPVMPTPAAVGDVVQAHAEANNIQVLCADIGGATTDVFSVFKDHSGKAVFNRTVSANLGMSYSVANVLVEAGVKNIARWLNYEISDFELRDRLRNKMIRPTSIPQSVEDLWLEQAVCREALRLSLQHHRSLAVGLSGAQRQRGIADIFAQTKSRYELVDLMKLDLVIGSGGVLSHAPSRMQAALMMIDGFGLEGLTQLAVDSIFMMPHLGVFASVHKEAATEIFKHDCLVNLGWSICPVWPKNKTPNSSLAKVYLNQQCHEIRAGEVGLIETEPHKKYKIRVEPHARIDAGAGSGEAFEREIEAGSCGVIIDGRNRPIQFCHEPAQNIANQKRIMHNLGLL